MNRYKIALLVLVLGASLINVVNAWQKQLVLPVNPNFGLYGAFLATKLMDAYEIEAEQNKETQKVAWLREIAIVTVGGVMWLLIPTTARTTK